ncbi:SCO family protein [Balneola sp. MJW-20]|uniref:SCO family protein n=1 Tax=Gracilimonas aurantiaca TaxID=3234185 RepID=UPI003467A713
MRRFALSAIVTLAVLSVSGTADAQLNQQQPEALQGVGIEEKLGDTIPMDLQFATSEGDSVRIGDLFEEGKPVLLNPLYYECPMLCGLVIDGMVNVIDELAWKPGEELIVISFSIDPKENAEVAARAKEKYISKLGDTSKGKGWYYLTGKQAAIDSLVNAVGFQYNEIEDTGEYAHPAAIMFLSPEGLITRYLYGIKYDEFNVRNALSESVDGKIGSTVERLVMYCYQYDPDSDSYAPVAINIMKLGGLATLIFLGIFLGLLWLREKRNNSTNKTEVI